MSTPENPNPPEPPDSKPLIESELSPSSAPRSEPPPQNIFENVDLSSVKSLRQKIRDSLMVKVFTVLFLLMISMIPVFFIQELISERERLQDDTISDINQKWAGQQTLAGPVLTIPYQQVKVIETEDYPKGSRTPVKKKQTVTTQHYWHVLPTQLKIKGQMLPQMLHRGIYHMVVYRSDLKLSGFYGASQFKNLPVENKHMQWNKAFISMGIQDLRGIEETIKLQFGPHKGQFDPGTVLDHLYTTGVHYALPLKAEQLKKTVHFSLNLKLKGNQRLFFTPVGKETDIQLDSPWGNPSFDGQFLPDERKISPAHFSAHWNVLHLNRNFPQSWSGKQHELADSAFGVRLIQPVDHYLKTERSVKYALFFIGLTYLTFFFVEVLTKRFVHPLQYLLIGFALCVFYTLLLSISEHLNFDTAYIIASSMTIVLITAYSAGILKSLSLTAVTAGVLLSLYGFIYTIIQQQDYALLMGSLGLFVVLALVMFFSRKIDFEKAL